MSMNGVRNLLQVSELNKSVKEPACLQSLLRKYEVLRLRCREFIDNRLMDILNSRRYKRFIDIVKVCNNDMWPDLYHCVTMT